MVNFLSRFSIRQQILIGFVPVLLILFFLAFSSFKNYQKFEQNFGLLRTTTQENIIFLQIERDIIELQRNVLVYSYVGYNGVLKKVEFLQTELEKKFEALKPIVESDDDIEQRFQRMVHHYTDYKQSFQQAIIEKNKIAALNNQKYLGLEKEAHQRLNDIINVFLPDEAYKMAYRIGQIEQNLYQTSSYIEGFQKTPDSVLVKETRLLIAEMQKQAEEIAKVTDNSKAQNILNDFQELMKEYRSVFGDITRANRSYLNLVNVVLAGKAAEIGKLSSELDALISKRSENLMGGIQKNSQRLQNQFLVLSFFAAIIGIFSSILIASGIADPVKSMASTLLNLSTGKVDTEIPGQARRDEVGQMAMAANEFKVMAKNLEYQTKELEEFAYRTSHDLRSPLVSSIALLQLTEEAIKEKDYDKARKSISHISTSLKKLEVLVKDILELTKTKNLSEKKTEIFLEKIIDEALLKISHMENFERLSIQKDLKDIGTFLSQKSRITLIVENLLSNAVKYQDLEKEKSVVRISTEKNGNDIVFSVEDNGLGIPEEREKEIFSMFKRFHPKVSFGSGLGLYMMKKSADVLGGQIEYEKSELGTKFKLLIPINYKEIS